MARSRALPASHKSKGSPRRGPPSGQSLAWKITGLGDGFSTPSVADGKLFVMGNRKDGDVEQEYVLAFDVRARQGGAALVDGRRPRA